MVLNNLGLFSGVYAKQPFAYVSSNEELKVQLNSVKYTNLIDQIRSEYEAGKSVDQLKLNCIAICCPGILMEGRDFEKANVIGNDIVPFDFDHMPIDVYDKLVDAVVQKRKEWNIKFVQNGVRHSVKMNNGSLHVLAGKQIETNSTGDKWIQEQQQALLKKLVQEVPECETYFDKAVVHYGRKLFLTKWSDIRYISLDFLEYNASTMNPFRNRNNVIQNTATTPSSQLTPKPLIWRGVSIDKIAEELILSEYADLDCKGEAHSAILSVVHTLTCITTNPEELYFAVQNIAKHHDDADKQRICQDAFKCTMGMIPNKLKEIVAKLKGNGSAQTVGATTANTVKTASSPSTANTSAPATAQDDHIQVLVSGNTIPLPTNMVPLYKAALAPVPDVHRKAGLCLIQGMLQVYCSNINVLGCDMRQKPIALNTIAVGPPSCGKSSVFSFLGDVVLDRQAKRDLKMQDDFDKWLEAKQMANNSKSLSAPPKVALRIFSNASRNGICLNLKNSGGKNSIIYTDELKSILKDQQKSYNDTQSLLCQGFDHQTTRNNSAMQSAFQGQVTVALASVMCSQPEYVEDFFGVTDGLATRCFFEVMNQTVSLDTPTYGTWTQDQLDIINDGIDKLENFSGIVDLPQCRSMLQSWMQSYALEYKEAEAKGEPIPFTMTLLSRRASDIALRCAAIAYVLCDCKESAAVKDICKYVANSVVQNTYLLLGEQFDKADSNGQKILKNKQNFKKLSADQRILEALPDGDFAQTEVEKAMKSIGNNPTANAVAVKISQLKRSGYIVKGKKKGTYKKASISK